jgi:ribosome-binding factor A
MASLKAKKVGSEMVKVISEIIANDSRDELLKTVTITACDVANDLSFAKVYFTSISELSNEQMEKELNEAASFIRTELASKIDLRIIPKLKFVYDNSIEYGNRIESILKEIKEENL